MKLIVTIDTEEDHWASYRTVENRVANIERLAELHALFNRYRVRPTYLVTYPVVTHSRSVKILRELLAGGNCEIGSHCHPWNTPPFGEDLNEHNSMLCNLPEELQFEKLKNLHQAIADNIQVNPVSFRAGRWGFGPGAARALLRLGYRVDCSVTPFRDWAIYQGPDFSRFGPQPFRFSPEDLAPAADGQLLEIPPTIGFLQGNFRFCHRLSKGISRSFSNSPHIFGVLSRLHLLNKVWLSPEHADGKTMVKLARRLEKLKYPCLHMTFHSPSLQAGLSPFVNTEKEERVFLQRIETVLQVAAEAGWESSTLAQFALDDVGRLWAGSVLAEEVSRI